jgi:hypothetical protein
MKFSKRNANTMHKLFKGNIYINNCHKAQTQSVKRMKFSRRK